MSNIEFDADIQGNPRYNIAQNNPASVVGGGSKIGMANWLVRHGILTSDSAAKAFLVGFIIVNFVASGLILYFFVL